MAGRGREAVLPAWMNNNNNNSQNSIGLSHADVRSNDSRRERSSDRHHGSRRHRDDRDDQRHYRDDRDTHRSYRSRSRSKSSHRHKSRRSRSHSRRKHSSRSDSRRRHEKSHHSSKHEIRKHHSHRDRSRSPESDDSRRRQKHSHRDREDRHRDKPRERSRSRSFSPKFRSSKRTRPSMWDIGPNDERVKHLIEQDANVEDKVLNERTKHARRLYVGGMIYHEDELREFFLDTLYTVLGRDQAEALGGKNMVVSVFVNQEKKFAFVELNSIELATAAEALHGLVFKGEPLKIRRPNDFDPLKVEKVGKLPTMVLERVGLDSSAVGMGSLVEGSNQVFVGGLPHHLSDDQVRELLEAFGSLKSLRVARDFGDSVSKGYAFCEYKNEKDTDLAIDGLNGLEIGDRVLNVRRAAAAGAPSGDSGTVSTVPSSNIVPTPVLVLLNMVTDEDLKDPEEYRDILDDIREECSNYGQVKSVNIPKIGDAGVGKVFVEYISAADALNARMKLEGRSFANRTVECQFMELDKFIRREFS